MNWINHPPRRPASRKPLPAAAPPPNPTGYDADAVLALVILGAVIALIVILAAMRLLT